MEISKGAADEGQHSVVKMGNMNKVNNNGIDIHPRCCFNSKRLRMIYTNAPAISFWWDQDTWHSFW